MASAIPEIAEKAFPCDPESCDPEPLPGRAPALDALSGGRPSCKDTLGCERALHCDCCGNRARRTARRPPAGPAPLAPRWGSRRGRGGA